MNQLIIENHGIKVEFNHGANLGIGIYEDLRDVRHAQIEYKDVEELKYFLDRGSEELKRRKDIINAGCERNNELREYIKQLLEMIPPYKHNSFIKQIKHELEI